MRLIPETLSPKSLGNKPTRLVLFSQLILFFFFLVCSVGTYVTKYYVQMLEIFYKIIWEIGVLLVYLLFLHDRAGTILFVPQQNSGFICTLYQCHCESGASIAKNHRQMWFGKARDCTTYDCSQ